MGTNYIAPMWRMPRNANKDKLSNYSIDFAGSNNYIDCDSGVSMVFLPTNEPRPSSTGNQLLAISPKSYSCWFKVDTTGTKTIFSSAPVGGGYHVKLDVNSSNLLEFSLRTPSPVYTNTTGTTTIAIDTWYHVLITVDGTNNKLYVNGTLEGTTACSGNMIFYQGGNSSNPKNLIGGYWTTSSTQDFNGSISQFCIFDYALSTDQINYLYNLNNPMAITGGEPTAYWPLGDNSNPNATAGYPNTSVGADSVFEFSTQDNIESSHIDMTGAMSISGWFKTTDTGYNMIYHEDLQIRTGGNRNWFFTTQGNLLRFSQFYNNGTFDNVSSSGITVNDGNWHHGVFVWDGTTNVDSMKIFVDGILRGKTTASNTNRNNHNVTGMIGSSNVNYNMIGELSNIQIWDANLTYGTASNLEDVAGGQVAELYNNGQPLMSGTQPQEANLKAWYKLNQTDSYWNIGETGKWTFNNAALN